MVLIPRIYSVYQGYYICTTGNTLLQNDTAMNIHALELCITFSMRSLLRFGSMIQFGVKRNSAIYRNLNIPFE